MSIAEKLTTIAENQQKVYEAGKEEGYEVGKEEGYEAGQKSEYDRFWDAFQDNGVRDNYFYAFAGPCWTNENFKPKYDMILDYKQNNTNSGQNIFAFATNIYGSLKEIFDSSGVKFDTQYVRNPTNMFNQTKNITELPYVDLSGTLSTASQVFYACGAETIKVTLPDRALNYNGCFRCSNLKNLEITGTIDGTNFSVQWSDLTHTSLMSIINALKDHSQDTSGTTWLIILGPDNIAKLTDEELNMIREKGWQYG